jgi:hypothetical protein
MDWKRPCIYCTVYTFLNCVKHRQCKYLMWIMTHYILILTKDCKKTGSTSRQREQTLAWLRWWGLAGAVNYRPVLSSERALQLSSRKSQGDRKIGRGSQMGAWLQDRLAGSLSVVMWLWLWRMGSGCRGPCFVDHVNSWRWVVSFTSGQLYPRRSYPVWRRVRIPPP